MSHFEAKMRHILFPASVRPSVRSSLRWSLTHKTQHEHAVPSFCRVNYNGKNTKFSGDDPTGVNFFVTRFDALCKVQHSLCADLP